MARRFWRYPIRPYTRGDEETDPPSYDLPVRPTIRNLRVRDPLNPHDCGWTHGGKLAAHHQGLRTIAFLQGWSASEHPGPPAAGESPDLSEHLAQRAQLVAARARLRRMCADVLVQIGDDDTAAIDRPTPEAS